MAGWNEVRSLILDVETGREVSLQEYLSETESVDFQSDLVAAVDDWEQREGLEGSVGGVVAIRDIAAWIPTSMGVEVWFDRYTLGPGYLGVVNLAIPLRSDASRLGVAQEVTADDFEPFAREFCGQRGYRKRILDLVVTPVPQMPGVALARFLCIPFEETSYGSFLMSWSTLDDEQPQRVMLSDSANLILAVAAETDRIRVAYSDGIDYGIDDLVLRGDVFEVTESRAYNSSTWGNVFICLASPADIGNLGPANPDSGIVIGLKYILEDLGLDPGPFDDEYSSATQEAVLSWQRSNNLPESGIVDAQTWLSLKQAYC